MHQFNQKNYFLEQGVKDGILYGYEVSACLHEEQTPFQKIAIYDTTTFGRLMTIDDMMMVTSRDNFLYHEMMTHTALFTHPNPKKVVIIGGGDCGSLREVLRHDAVISAIQVEIDERVTRLSEQYFPELCESNADARASLIFADGIQWIADSPDNSIDVLIIDSTDPVGPAEGLFNQAFYRQCRRVLGSQGLLIQQSESPLLHHQLIQDMRAAMLAVGFHSTQTLSFPQPAYPSGWWSATMACATPTLPEPNIERIATRSFSTKYYNQSIHLAALAVPEFMRNDLGNNTQ